jgi:transcriptional regulator with XRE-family HTH domain
MNIQNMIIALLELYTQEALAEELGVDQSTVSRYKTGERKRIDYETGLKVVALHKRKKK